MITPTVKALGYEVVNISLIKKTPKILEIIIDRLDREKVKVLDCAYCSKAISTILDVESIINDRYLLEVASVGIERSLSTIEDFRKFLGYTITVKLISTINNSKKYMGKIFSVEEQDIILELQDSNIISIAHQNIKAANIVFTNDMFKQIIKNSNAGDTYNYG